MLCEECSREIDVVVCGACGRSVPRLGPFCCHCGRKLESEGGALPGGQQSDEEPISRAGSFAAMGPASASSTSRGSARYAGSRTRRSPDLRRRSSRGTPLPMT